MPQEVQGYLTVDNQFFDNSVEAELHEAVTNLGNSLKELNVDPEKFFEVMQAVMPLVGRYINAYEENQNYQAQLPVQREDGEAQEDRTGVADSGVDEHTAYLRQELASLQQFEAGGYEPMSDMGYSPQPEAISDERALDGIGSGGTDARSVRSRADMAVVDLPKFTKARARDGSPHFREVPLGEDMGRKGR